MPGFNPGMPPISKPPIGLTDDEILAVIAYLQSLGGTTTVTMETKLVAGRRLPRRGDAPRGGRRRQPAPRGRPAMSARVTP